MTVEEWTLLVAVVGTPASLLTLAVVIKTELEQRRRWPAIMWSFSRYGTRHSVPPRHVTELIQYGGTPTRVSSYYPVGFRVHPEEEARLRLYVKGEDRLPLFIEAVDPGNAWLVIHHAPRDDNRWMYMEWVPLDPIGDDLRDQMDARWPALNQERHSVKGWLTHAWRRLARRSIVRPVGPGSYGFARVRADRELTEEMIQTIYSEAKQADPDSGWTVAHEAQPSPPVLTS